MNLTPQDIEDIERATLDAVTELRTQAQAAQGAARAISWPC